MAEFRCKRDEWKGEVRYEIQRDGDPIGYLRQSEAGGWSYFHLEVFAPYCSEAAGRSIRARINRLGRQASLREVLPVIRHGYEALPHA